MFGTAANFLYNSLFSRNTRSLKWGQFFNQSLQKLVQMKHTCFKTLKLQNFMRSLHPKLARKSAQTHISCANGHRKIKINSKGNFEVRHLFVKLFSRNLETLSP